MKRVTGIGGIFMLCKDPQATAQWYKKHLGLDIEDWLGVILQMQAEVTRQENAYQLLSFFPANSTYLKPSTDNYMINLRVADLDGLIALLKAEGISLEGEPVAGEYGKFAWIMDPDGRKIELWQQV